ncbi:MAG: bifunctional riboflavin kinase/FAD synthetase [Actinomycetota bacterium]
MKTLVGLGSLRPPPQGSAITIGTFDGIHLGHRALIAHTVAAASEAGLAAVVVTWDRHPNETLRPERAPLLLTSPERKAELMLPTGVDYLVVLPFDRALSTWPPERFVRDVLVQGLGGRRVLVGAGWRFGHKAAGDVPLLEKLGAEMGFVAAGLDLAAHEGVPISSSRVREAVAAGEVELAAELLGRPFDVDGIVVRGAGRGDDLGYPTANVDVAPKLVKPRRGVYAGRTRVDETWYQAAINVGVNPTFGGDEASTPVMVETYLLDFAGELHGLELRVEFHRRLRDELKFDSVDDLVAQMARDVEATRELTC